MRTATTLAVQKITQAKGLSSQRVLEIDWPSGTKVYGDRAQASIEGRLLSMDAINNVINVFKNSSQQTVSVKLDDIDGSLKLIFNSVDVHKITCRIYQWFSELPYSDRLLLFTGVISSPITWSSGDRTLTFTIISRIEDREVGFAPEEGKFDAIPAELVGLAWPYIFGTVYRSKCLQLDPIPQAITLDPTAIRDQNIEFKRRQLQNQIDQLQVQVREIMRRVEDLTRQSMENLVAILVTSDTSLTDQANQMRAQASGLISQINQLEAQRIALAQNLVDQIGKEASVIRVHGADRFPQGTEVSIRLNEALHTGYFSSQHFSIATRLHPGKEKHLNNPSATIAPLFTTGFFSELNTAALGVPGFDVEIKEGDFLWIPPGTNIVYESNLPVRYIAAANPCTVTNVWAKKTFGGGASHFLSLPSNYYTVSVQSFGSVQATIVTLIKPLSMIDDGWSDDIYVDIAGGAGFTSNAVDIMKWAITNYTSLNFDSTTFNAVTSQVAPFPMNFALREKKNVLQFLQEIAYQARCAIWSVNNTFFLRYLPQSVASVDALTEDDILNNTMEIGCTSTEDVITVHEGTYRLSYDQDEPFKIVVRSNVLKYGTIRKEIDYYAYTNPSLVRLVATFWAIRESNTYKMLKFSTPLHKLRLEGFDPIALNFSFPWVANGSVQGIIEDVSYDNEEEKLDFSVWVPVRLGEMTKYNFVNPVDTQDIYPSAKDQPGAFSPTTNATGNLNPTNGASRGAVSARIGKRTTSIGTVGPENIDHGDPQPGAIPSDASALLANTNPGPISNAVAPSYPNTNTTPIVPSSLTDTDLRFVLPGRIVSGSGPDYIVMVFPRGLNNPGVQVSANNVAHNDTDTHISVDDGTEEPFDPTLSPGLHVMVTQVTWKEGQTTRTARYFKHLKLKTHTDANSGCEEA